MTTDNLLKYLAIVFLFIVMLGCFIVTSVQIIEGVAPSPYAISILGSGLGYAMTIAGVQHGSNIIINSQSQEKENK